METRQTAFEKNLEFGKVAESRIALWMMRRGFSILPAYEKELGSYKGPQLFALDERLVTPDILAMRNDKIMWIEAKHKSVFSWHRITQKWVTGIDLHHYYDYLRIAKKFPHPVWLFFLHANGYTEEYPHDCPTGLFGEDILKLRHKENHRSDKWGKRGMVYWAHDSLIKICSVDNLYENSQIKYA